MSEIFAVILSLFFIGFLCVRDYLQGSRGSWALWVPLIWLLIAGSRQVVFWLEMAPPGQTEADVMSGNPIDAAILLILIGIGLFIVINRANRVVQYISANPWVILLLSYCGFSILWSDFEFVSFKRWIKEIGNLLMVLIILTESSSSEAVKWIMRRCGYILILMSVTLIRYYPELSRHYNPWTGEVTYIGVAGSKNMLGILCFVFGLFFLWEIMSRWRDSKSVFDFLFLAMIFYLFRKADSMGAVMAFLVGAGMLVGLRMIRENVQYVTGYVVSAAATLGVLLFLVFEFNMMGMLMDTIGRDVTLTGRSTLWETIIDMVPNPLIGVGYDSFWLGDRLKELWSMFWWRPNQAHNGYLEIYLNLGLIGVFIFACVVLSSYRHCREGLIHDFEYGTFRVTLLVVALVFNLTEAVFFKGASLLWILFLVIGMDVRAPVQYNVQENGIA